MQNQMIRRGCEILALAVVYYVTARLGLLLAIPPGYATPIRPAAGIALGAVLIFGKHIAPGIWLGAFLAHAATSFDPGSPASHMRSMLLPLGIATGATLQAIVGAILIRRFVGYPTPLLREKDVIMFLSLGGPVNCVVGATVGTITLFATDTLPAINHAFIWMTWWVGNSIGVLVVVPLVLTCFGKPRKAWRHRWKTVALPLCLAMAVIVGVFMGAKETFFAVDHSVADWVVLACGLAFTGLLGAFLLVMSGHAMLFKQLAAERTAELVRARQAEETARQLAAIVASSDDAIIGTTLDGTIVSWNAGAERTYGYRASEMLGRSVSDLFPPDMPDETQGILTRLGRGERIDHHETVRMRKDGQLINVSLCISPIRNLDGKVVGASAIARDISERKRAEEAMRETEVRIRRLMEANIIGVIFWDKSGRISDANDAFLRLSGFSRQDLRAGALRWTDMTPPECRTDDERAMEELNRTGASTPFEKEFIHKDGSRVPVLIGCATLNESRDKGVSFVLDLSARKQAEERIRHIADHDALTGLPNRLLLQDRMHQAIAYGHRNKTRVAILFIDLDYFKNINDSLGHHIGDAVLQMAAARLQKCLREGDSVARLGGDEFVLCLPMLNDSSDAALVAKKALDTLAQPFIVEGRELHVSGSIGISVYPDDASDVETLMRTADTAMYHAKEMGRGNFQFFTPALNQAAQQRLDVSTRLRHALAQSEFVLHYQPQVNMESGRTFSTEALLRWRSPGKQPISCGAFIVSAEESGLIVQIGEWTLRQACKQLRIWHDAGYPQLKMAVNLSPRQLEQANFCSLLGQILDETGIVASDLELEITESILMQHSEFNLATLTRLSEMGIRLSMDDFGTGYSSLAYLQRFPVHAIKIDQSFIRDIGKDPNDTALITAIIAMAASLHLKVVAEGVETSQQAQFLLAHGCVAGQGFYYSKAVPAETLSELFRTSLNPMPSTHPELRL